MKASLKIKSTGETISVQGDLNPIALTTIIRPIVESIGIDNMDEEIQKVIHKDFEIKVTCEYIDNEPIFTFEPQLKKEDYALFAGLAIMIVDEMTEETK